MNLKRSRLVLLFFNYFYNERVEWVNPVDWMMQPNKASIPKKVFLVGVFEENARLLQWLVFFRQFNATGALFLFCCSFVQLLHQLIFRLSEAGERG